LATACNKTNPEAKAKQVANDLCACLKQDPGPKQDECLDKVTQDTKAYKDKLSAADQEKFDNADQAAAAECRDKLLDEL